MKRQLVLVLGLLAAVSAGGCRLDPPHARPDVDARPTWREQAAEVESLANVAWFDLYQDETLGQLIRDAIAGNVDLQAALARIDEARALARAAGADLYPRLDLAAAAGGVRSTEARAGGGDRNTGTYALSFDLSWEIDVFGRIRSQTDAARAAYFASVEAHRDVGIRLVSEVARAYFELRDLDERLAIAERTLKSRQEYVDLAKVRFEGGKTSELDFRQAESEYYRTEVVYVDVKRQIAAKEHEISVLLGRAPDAVPRGRTAAAQPLPAAVPAGLPSDLLQRRPDIRVAEENLVGQTALVGAARANLYPRIALTGTYGWESDALSDLFTSPANTASLIAGLLQPIFNAGRNRALVEAQCARMRIAMEAYRKTVLVAFREVEDALVDYRNFTEQRVVEEKRVEALRKVLSLAETRYVGGVAQYLEVLDAQRQLFDAELEQAATIQAQLVSLTVLYKALGGGWYCESCPNPLLRPCGTPYVSQRAPCASRSAPCAPCPPSAGFPPPPPPPTSAPTAAPTAAPAPAAAAAPPPAAAAPREAVSATADDLGAPPAELARPR